MPGLAPLAGMPDGPAVKARLLGFGLDQGSGATPEGLTKAMHAAYDEQGATLRALGASPRRRWLHCPMPVAHATMSSGRRRIVADLSTRAGCRATRTAADPLHDS